MLGGWDWQGGLMFRTPVFGIGQREVLTFGKIFKMDIADLEHRKSGSLSPNSPLFNIVELDSFWLETWLAVKNSGCSSGAPGFNLHPLRLGHLATLSDSSSRTSVSLFYPLQVPATPGSTLII